MVAHLVRLKLQLLKGSLRGRTGRIIVLIIGALYGLMIVGFGVVGLVALRLFGNPEVSRIVLVCGGSLAVLGWLLLPLFAFGIDETLDPLRFQTFAIPMKRLVTGLFAASFVSVPAAATTLLLLVTTVTWSYSVPAVLVAVIGALLGAGTCVAVSRAATSAVSSALASRRWRDVLSIIGLVAVVAFGPVVNLVTQHRMSIDDGPLTGVATVLGWTPLGFAFAAPADAATGHLPLAILRLVLAAATLGLLLLAWTSALKRTLERGPTHRQVSTGLSSGLGWFSTLPGTPSGAIAARTVTYWRRDPRYFGSIAMLVLLPLIVVVYSLVVSDSGTVASGAYLAVAPIVAYMIGWGVHSDVSMDNTAFALHVSSGVSGRADRIGRLAPWLVVGLPVVVIYAVAASGLTGRWDLLPATIGLSACLLGAGLGLSAVTSVTIPYPSPGPGDSPFRTPPGATGITMLVQFATLAAVVVLSLPILVTALIAMFAAPGIGWIVLPAGVVLGGVYLVVGVRLGASTFDRRAPDILARIHGFASS
ncbi:transporter [Spelaeicoccus albus]|uniref:ABC-2 type transport system permease protein n=1 Tax=Spelaeicoccus albus TaxID=1280376 RepID=A0A7Z0D5K4_9MICO|nr:transporter [Spelaeicoccus albus]NYI69234.1 ABC-2 type transport system permease protein [Spelaeicoccus albus]